jgi:hypothetical protein
MQTAIALGAAANVRVRRYGQPRTTKHLRFFAA